MKLFHYDLPLYNGTQRKGILAQLPSGAWGQASPLPGFSQETYEDALLQLQNLKQNMTLHPSVEFALEAAHWMQPTTLPIASLLLGTKLEILEKAARSKKEGFTHAKVKLRGLTQEDAFEIVNALKDDFRLRIDLNRTWDLKDSLQFFSHFSPDAFDYIEEPVSRSEDLQYFSHPFALDETIREQPPEKFLTLKNLKALIFRPMMHGGLSALNQLMKLGKPIVMSGAYESGVGIFQIATLVQRSGLPILPLGIDTYRFLKHDLLKAPFRLASGKLELPSTIEPDMQYLHELHSH